QLSCDGFLAQLVAQRSAQDLADIRLGELAAEIHPLRHLVSRELLAAVVDDLLLGDVVVLPDDEERHDLARSLVRLRDGRDLEHAWMRRGDAFDFVRIDVETGYEDHVLLAILDVHEAFFVHATDITRSQPIPEHDLRGLVRTVPVASHHLRTTHADLADLADTELVASIVANADFGGRNRQTDGAVEVERRRERIDAGCGRSLGQPPGLRQHIARDLLPVLRDGPLYRHTAAEGDAQLAEIHFREAGRVQQGIEERVDAADVAELVLLQLLHERAEIPRIHDEDIARAELDEDAPIRGEGEDMVERQRRDDRVATGSRI